MEAVVASVDLVLVVVWLSAVAVCFLKGRKWFGIFGIAWLALSVPLWFQLVSLSRSGEIDDGWVWLSLLQGGLVLILLAIISIGPPASGSWWHRRHHTERGARSGQAPA